MKPRPNTPKLLKKNPMNSSVKNLNPNQIKLTVELDKEELKKYIAEAETALGADLELKGFRKGKAPKDVVRKHLDPDQVRGLALEMALEQSLSDTVREKELDVIETSQLNIEKNEADSFKYSVVVDLFPEVKLADLSKIKVERKKVEISDKEMEETLDTLRNARATFADKEDGTAANGDRVEVDFEVRDQGAVIDGGVSTNHPLILGGKNFIPGFEEAIVGMKKGETKEFSLNAPEDYFHKAIAGKKLDFKVTLKEVKKVIMPELTDDFAKTLGRFTGLAELKNNIRDGLAREKEVKEKQRLQLEILDKVIEASEIEVGASLVDRQLDLMVQDFDHTLHERGLELGLYLAQLGKTEDELRKDWRKEAEKQVKISLVLRKVSKNVKLDVSEEEVNELAAQLVTAAAARGEDTSRIDPARVRDNVVSKLINDKALDYLEALCAV